MTNPMLKSIKKLNVQKSHHKKTTLATWRSERVNHFLNNGKECIILNNCLEISLLKEYYRKNTENRKKNSEFEKRGHA